MGFIRQYKKAEENPSWFMETNQCDWGISVYKHFLSISYLLSVKGLHERNFFSLRRIKQN